MDKTVKVSKTKKFVCFSGISCTFPQIFIAFPVFKLINGLYIVIFKSNLIIFKYKKFPYFLPYINFVVLATIFFFDWLL